jgi:hypothetical protein
MCYLALIVKGLARCENFPITKHNEWKRSENGEAEKECANVSALAQR